MKFKTEVNMLSLIWKCDPTVKGESINMVVALCYSGEIGGFDSQ
jgi:hypothetical protein